jgi:hypothetical protein
MTETSRVRLCSMTPDDRLPALKTYIIELTTGDFLQVKARNVMMATDGMPETIIKAVEEVR